MKDTPTAITFIPCITHSRRATARRLTAPPWSATLHCLTGCAIGEVLAHMRFLGAAPLALAADTASITAMEIVDNGIMLAIPGAMDAGFDTMVSEAASRLRSQSPR